MTSVYQVALMGLLCIGGWLCFKLNIVNLEGSKCLTSIVLNIACPAMIMKSFLVPYDPEHIKDWGYTGLLGLIALLVSIAVVSLTISHKNKDRRAIEHFSAIYTNSGFLGIPLVKGVFGDQGVFYASAYFAVYGILIFTHGEMMIKSNGQKITLKETMRSVCSALKSPAIVATAIGAVCFFSQIKLPKLIIDFVGYGASLTTPLAMIVAGVMISQTNFKALFKNIRLYYLSFVCLILIPAITMAIFYFLPHDYLPMGAVLISTACPSATFGIMLAVKYNKETVYATEIFAFTTMLCMITIPSVMAIFDLLFK
jgi:predicted permease